MKKIAEMAKIEDGKKKKKEMAEMEDNGEDGWRWWRWLKMVKMAEDGEDGEDGWKVVEDGEEMMDGWNGWNGKDCRDGRRWKGKKTDSQEREGSDLPIEEWEFALGHVHALLDVLLGPQGLAVADATRGNELAQQSSESARAIKIPRHLGAQAT
jgi:hypothetical protein